MEKTCLPAVLEVEGRMRDVTQTFRIVDDFATQLQGSIRRCQVFRVEFDLVRANNGNCSTDDTEGCDEQDGKRRFRGRFFAADSPEKMELALKLKAFEPL